MSKPQIAVQMMMLAGKVKELGLYETLKKVNEMGFNAVEISQVDMSEENVVEMERAVNELGMNICSLSAYTQQVHPSFPVDSFDLHFDKIVNDAKRLDVQYLRIGSLPFQHYGKPEMFVEFAKEMEMWGAKLREHGIKLFYHNHLTVMKSKPYLLQQVT